MFRTALLASLAASAAAFAPGSMSAQRGVALNAKMSDSIPFLPCPEKLDGSMPGDVGFDPMGLSEIQQDLTYARWAELKHGRIAMLAIVGLLTQTYIHLPGEAYQNSDPFGAVSTVGFGVNVQIFAAIGIVELTNFNKHYDGSTPGDIDWTGGLLKGKSEEQIAKLKEQEIKHCRLAMVAITGASVQTLMFHQPLLG
mmetsp:Transcript_6028/g.3615  ORF Transcript_6028/g.3615 Transcript_6028/m.3615 type:complete len:197 (-) Transcript_6028:87-677(-)|eukprot:CAMPEP_0203634014 /NCGR_PEP_ID=MMETSP0088-20131115/1053_1 /ASSEMBLY_ACC=CAM_ASM_001087 /TAXON_ID=426623 /ORGANISM="Chaetoceros affinis, Strain CCMP159" /LENGTH=196 /DNA_ID=CAMNT_0050487515 /DNA_START=53 /DNA_END=643 /DNA_ORIENTATION=-